MSQIDRGCVKTHRAAKMPESACQFRGRTFDSERSQSIESQIIALSRNRLRIFTQSRPIPAIRLGRSLRMTWESNPNDGSFTTSIINTLRARTRLRVMQV